MRADELTEHRRREERRVARQDEHVVDGAAEPIASTADGIAGAARLLLHCDREAVEGSNRRRRGDDDDRIDAELARRLEHPVHHTPTEDRVKVLRHRRVHARAEARRHDDGA